MTTPPAVSPSSAFAPSFTTFFDSSANTTTFNPIMAIVIIVLIGGCFVLGLSCVFIRRCMVGESRPHTYEINQTRSSTAKSKGLDQSIVDSLPVVHYKDLADKEEHECPVCLTDFEPHDSLRLLPKCKHVFHTECIDMWFHSHSTCPLCRASLSEHDGDAKDSSNERAAPQQPGDTVTVDVENGDDAGQSQHHGDALVQDGSPVPAGVAITREDERTSTRRVLSRNSLSFKRAARGNEAYESSASPAAGHLGKTASFSSTKPPSTPLINMGIRRSSSLGTDLKTLRNLIIGSEIATSSANAAKSEALVSTWYTRATSMDFGVRDRLNTLPTPTSGDQWISIDLETGEASAAESRSKGHTSNQGPAPGTVPERTWSDRWSLASLKGVMFPLRRSRSDISSRTQHLPT